MAACLAAVRGQAPAEQVEAEAAQEEPTAEEPEKEPSPEAEKKFSIEDDEAFSDEALSSPEAIKKARALLQETRRASHRKYLELNKRETRFKRDKAETLQLRDNLRAQFGVLQNDIQALRNGDANTVLTALSRLSGGRDASELFQEISINLARNGKRGQPSPEVVELRTQLEQLQHHLRERDEREKQAETQRYIAQEKQHIAKLASDASAYPLLSSWAEENPQGVADDVAQYILAQHQQGVTLDYATALSQIETQLRSRFARIQPKLATAQTVESGRETGAVANPGAPQVGKSLTPSLATQTAGISRAASESELLAKAAQELPSDFWAQFGMT